MDFGLHLKQSGVITAEQLVSAIETQLNTLVPIGQIALEEGMLTARQIFEVLRAQNNAPRILFGELAIKMRLLTRNDVMRLLMIQADRRQPIGDILVKQGVLSSDRVAQELLAYRKKLSTTKKPSTAVVFVPEACTAYASPLFQLQGSNKLRYEATPEVSQGCEPALQFAGEQIPLLA